MNLPFHFICLRNSLSNNLAKIDAIFSKSVYVPFLRVAIALCPRPLDCAFYDAVEPIVAS